MDKDEATSSRPIPKPDSHIPPPTDPYVTYQTPYARRPSDDAHNPFIEFRRAADAAFTLFFSNLPRVLGTENFKASNRRDLEEEYFRRADEKAATAREGLLEKMRLRAEASEGFRKKLEQNLEERRRAYEERMEEHNQLREEFREKLREKMREKMQGRLLNRSGLHSELNDSRDDNLKAAETELDLYDGLGAYEAKAYKPSLVDQKSNSDTCPWKDGDLPKKCPWDASRENDDRTWMSGLGYDGRRKAKSIPLFVPAQPTSQSKQDRNAEWKHYRDDEMDPFTDDDHVVPWFKLSPYSPLLLMNNDAWMEAFNQPRPVDLKHVPLSDFPFDEAFEDLMAVHKTGRLPVLLKQLVYPNGPNQWMMDMVQRGVLGPKWEESFMAAGLLNHGEKTGAVRGSMWRGFDGFKKQWARIAHRDFGELNPRTDEIDEQLNDEDEYEQPGMDHDASQWEDLIRNAFRSKMKEAYDQMEELAQTVLRDQQPADKAYGARGMLWPSPEEIFGAIAQGRAQSQQNQENDLVASREIESEESVTKDESWSSLSTSSWTPAVDEKPETLVSTFTTTTTRTLPDGSVETKRLLKKRFADGREESNESTEAKLPVASHSIDQAPRSVVGEVSEEAKSKNGWFWN